MLIYAGMMCLIEFDLLCWVFWTV